MSAKIAICARELLLLISNIPKKRRCVWLWVQWLYFGARGRLDVDSCCFGLHWSKRSTFWKDCLCTLSALQKGMTHAPYPLLKYKEFTPETHKFEMRTFEQLRADQKRRKESGCRKSEVKEYYNCEFESLFKGLLFWKLHAYLSIYHWGLAWKSYIPLKRKQFHSIVKSKLKTDSKLVKSMKLWET